MNLFIRQPFRVVVFLTLSLNAIATESIELSIGEWPPYVSEKMENYGIAAHIVTEAFAISGVDTNYSFFPWNRAYFLAKEGRSNGTLPWIKTADRETYFDYSDVIIEGAAVFFHLKTYPFDWKTIDDLQGIKLGGLQSASYPWLDNAIKEGKSIDMQLVINDEQNFRKLLKGRIHAFSLDINTGYSTLNKLFSEENINKITHHKKPIEIWSYHLLLSKKNEKNKNVLLLFNEGLRALKENGKYQSTLQQFNKSIYNK